MLVSFRRLCASAWLNFLTELRSMPKGRRQVEVLREQGLVERVVSVVVLLVLHGVGLGRVSGAVRVPGRRVDRIELEGLCS